MQGVFYELWLPPITAVFLVGNIVSFPFSSLGMANVNFLNLICANNLSIIAEQLSAALIIP